MRPRSIGTLSAVSVLVCATCVVSAQQSKPIQPQKAPSPETKAEKKPSIIVFNPSGSPQPTQKPGRPKGVPPFRPLSEAEKIRIVQEIPGLPHNFSAVTPYLTLSPMHVLDPRGALDLHWPAVTSWASATYGTFPFEDGQAKTFNAKTVELFLQVDSQNVYLVDFSVFIFAPVSFKVTVQGMDPMDCKTIQPGADYVTVPVYVTENASGIYRVILQVCPPSTGGGWPYPDWVFGFVEVTKFVPVSS